MKNKQKKEVQFVLPYIRYCLITDFSSFYIDKLLQKIYYFVSAMGAKLWENTHTHTQNKK